MEIRKIDPGKPDLALLRLAAEYILAGKIVIQPTETVYGLAAKFSDEAVLKKCASIKRRSTRQPFSIMVMEVRQILEVSGIRDREIAKFLKRILPNPITVLLPRLKPLPQNYWNQFSHLGFRLPDHLLSTKLMELIKLPIITTSANFTGHKSPANIQEIPVLLQKQVDLILDGGQTEKKTASTIIRIDLNPLKIHLVRKGAFPWENIQRRFVNGS